VTHLLPRSLFARMVLVLLAGLLFAQLLSFAIYWRERGELALRATGMRSAQRIADIVKLLDSTAPAERARIVKVLDAPPLRISLDAPPLAPMSGADERAEHAARFTALLRHFLREDRPLVVQVTDAPPWAPGMHGMMGGPGMMGGKGAPGPGAHPPGQPGMSFVVQARLADGTRVTFDSRQPAEAADWPYRLLVSLTVLLVAVVAVTLVAVRWVTRPLKTLAQAAETLGEDINRPPLDERGPHEVRSAARAFNLMQERLARFIRDRTRIFAAMSHDLKTPITRMRLRSELLEDPQLRAKFVKDLEEMESLISTTLDFMRGLDDREAAQPLDIMALLESLQEDAREVSGDVRIEGGAHAPFHGHARALRRCLGNLIDNAVKYGKSATVDVEDTGGQLRIRVRDQGPGIPEADLERVFEPFHRLEGSRSRDTGGTGLGLSIARNIARAHGGEIVLRNSPAGGLEATLSLPRRAGSVRTAGAATA
jgi:signal transduction histidine kinase